MMSDPTNHSAAKKKSKKRKKKAKNQLGEVSSDTGSGPQAQKDKVVVESLCSVCV